VYDARPKLITFNQQANRGTQQFVTGVRNLRRPQDLGQLLEHGALLAVLARQLFVDHSLHLASPRRPPSESAWTHGALAFSSSPLGQNLQGYKAFRYD
jgi:hypothetical protein